MAKYKCEACGFVGQMGIMKGNILLDRDISSSENEDPELVRIGRVIYEVQSCPFCGARTQHLSGDPLAIRKLNAIFFTEGLEEAE